MANRKERLKIQERNNLLSSAYTILEINTLHMLFNYQQYYEVSAISILQTRTLRLEGLFNLIADHLTAITDGIRNLGIIELRSVCFFNQETGSQRGQKGMGLRV